MHAQPYLTFTLMSPPPSATTQDTQDNPSMSREVRYKVMPYPPLSSSYASTLCCSGSSKATEDITPPLPQYTQIRPHLSSTKNKP